MDQGTTRLVVLLELAAEAADAAGYQYLAKRLRVDVASLPRTLEIPEIQDHSIICPVCRGWCVDKDNAEIRGVNGVIELCRRCGGAGIIAA